MTSLDRQDFQCGIGREGKALCADTCRRYHPAWCHLVCLPPCHTRPWMRHGKTVVPNTCVCCCHTWCPGYWRQESGAHNFREAPASRKELGSDLICGLNGETLTGHRGDLGEIFLQHGLFNHSLTTQKGRKRRRLRRPHPTTSYQKL